MTITARPQDRKGVPNEPGIQGWSDEEGLWAPTEEPRLPTKHAVLIRCAELLIATGLPHSPRWLGDFE